MHRRTWTLLTAMLALIALIAAPTANAAKSKKKPKKPYDVLVVSNNWDGTADFVNPKTFKRYARLNIIPDNDERVAEIEADPVRLGYFLAIQQLVGEGHHQYVDDAFTSPDGKVLYVARPGFADVVAINLKTRKIAWRTPVEGNRADHMAIARGGSRLLVSASTANKVHAIDTKTVKTVGGWQSGDQPHESSYSN